MKAKAMTNPLVNLIIEVARSQLTPNEQAQICSALDACNDDVPIKEVWRKGDDREVTVDCIECPDGTLLFASDGVRGSCNGCVFSDSKLHHGMGCDEAPRCAGFMRTDGRSIIWAKP